MPASTRSSRDRPDPHLWITVLAGGVGSRFWPVSTPSRPKQLLPLAGERPLVADAVDRARSLAPDRRILILTGVDLLDPLRRILPDLPESSFLPEPVSRGTAPALAWAASRVVREDPDAVIVSLHADHVIRPTRRFARLLGDAAEVAAETSLLLTVGASPDRPETGFGYIQPGEPLRRSGAGNGRGSSAFRVRAFHEKPDAETAARYVADGYLWNTGIFVWKASTFLEELERHAPEVGELLPLLGADDVEGFFGAAPTVTVDVAVLERSDRVGAVRADFAWDDLGSWEALARTGAADPDGNVVRGEGWAVDSSDNVVYVEDGAVVLFGVEDMVVVRTPEVTLVAPRERTPHLKELLARLPEALRRPGS